MPRFCRTSACTADGSVEGLADVDAPLAGEMTSLAFSKIAWVLQRCLKSTACRLLGSGTGNLFPKNALRPVAKLAMLVWPQDSMLAFPFFLLRRCTCCSWCKRCFLGQGLPVLLGQTRCACCGHVIVQTCFGLRPLSLSEWPSGQSGTSPRPCLCT